jgi:hypothetical protein
MEFQEGPRRIITNFAWAFANISSCPKIWEQSHCPSQRHGPVQQREVAMEDLGPISRMPSTIEFANVLHKLNGQTWQIWPSGTFNLK